MHFQVDPYSKDPDPPAKMWRILSSGCAIPAAKLTGAKMDTIEIASKKINRKLEFDFVLSQFYYIYFI